MEVPLFEPPFLTETDERYWRDCTVISALRCSHFANPTIPITVAEREKFERTGGHVGESGVFIEQVNSMTLESYGHILSCPSNWEAFKTSLIGEARGFVDGYMGNLTPHLKRWSPGSAFATGHTVNVGPYDPSTDQFWWVDPLGRDGYIGEWVAAADVQKFAWGFPYWKTIGRNAWINVEVKYGMASVYVPIMPKQRILDTRISLGLSGKFERNIPRALQVAGNFGVPIYATSVVGNLTVTNQTAAGYFSITSEKPLGIPPTSDLNFPLSDIRANGGIHPLDVNGIMWITYEGKVGATTDAIFDVAGFFVPTISGAI